MSRDEWIGMASLLGGVTLFSTVEIAGKMIGHRVDPIALTFIRFFVTGVVLVALSIPTLRLRVTPLAGRDWGFFCLNGFVGIALAISLFHVAVLAFEKAASSAVVFCANPVFVLLFGRFVNNETWSPRKWLAVVLGAVGVSLFALESGGLARSSITGLAVMLLAAALFGLSICMAKRKMADYGAKLLMGFSALFGSLMILPVAIFRTGSAGLAGLADAWLPIAYVTLLGTTAAYFLYYFGLLNTSLHGGSLTFFLKPVLASVLAIVILKEQTNIYMIAGTLLIFGGLASSMIGSRSKAAGKGSS